MTLGEILHLVADRAPALFIGGTGGPDAHTHAPVTVVAYDSRHATPGSIFVALRGLKADGIQFARDAIDRGATCVVAESPAPPDLNVRWVHVADARLALAALSAAFYGDPSRELALIGITGTNGKTTTSYVLTSIFEAAGVKCGRIGTIGYSAGRHEVHASRTTPEAPDLQRLLRQMVSEGCGACVIEVSSHALALKRVDALRFAGAVFTNLTRDHLDFHSSMEDYFQAKRRLFTLLPTGAFGVTNADDPRGAAVAAASPRAVTYAIDAAADVRPGPLALTLEGLRFDVRTSRGTLQITSPLVGRPNVYNILAAIASAMTVDLPFSAIEQGVARLSSVPGRFQLASGALDEVRVVVDYAHTDDALKNLLETARPLAAGRIITVFGCGGDRDRSKRPLMGAVAARLSDLVILTSDNPRSEDPARIIEEIKRGIVLPPDRVRKGQPAPASTPCLTIIDRKAAIDKAVSSAKPGDLVLIAGKGHEHTQTIGSRVLPFDDVDVARGALVRRRTGTRVS